MNDQAAEVKQLEQMVAAYQRLKTEISKAIIDANLKQLLASQLGPQIALFDLQIVRYFNWFSLHHPPPFFCSISFPFWYVPRYSI